MKQKNRLVIAAFAPVSRFSIIVCASLCAATSTYAQTNGVWTATASGSWSGGTNWSDGNIANAGGTAAFGTTTDIPAAVVTVTVDSARNVSALTFSDSDPLTAGSWSTALGGFLTLSGTRTVTTNVNAAMTGAFATHAATDVMNKAGAGTLELNGLTTAWPGIIDVPSGNGSVRLRGNLGINATAAGGFTGNGLIFVLGGGTTTMDNNVGLLNFSGTLEVGQALARYGSAPGLNGSVLPNVSLDLKNAGNYLTTVAWTNTRTYEIGALTGGAGSFVSGSSNTTAGNTGTVEFKIGAKGLNTTFGGIVRDNNGTSPKISSTALDKVGSGTLTLTGANTHTGPTKVTAGTLSVGNGGATGSLAATNVAVGAAGTLVFNRDSTSTSAYPGNLSGTGAVIKKGAGQVDLNGVNLHSAGTEIQGGTIGVNNASSLGSGGVTFTTADGGVVSTAAGVAVSTAFNVASGITATFGATLAANSLEVQNPITGDGSVNVGGTGVVIFSGDNDYLGSTTVTSGTLVASSLIDPTSTGPVSVNTGGNLAGTGTITGAVTVDGGIKPGALTAAASSVGTLNFSSLALNGGGILYAEFANASSYDLVSVTGALTTNASISNPILVDLRSVNSLVKWSTPGTYDLISFGSFSGSADDLFEVTTESQAPGATYTFSVVGNSIRLTIGGTLPSEWNLDADGGNWSVAGNWLNGVPGGVGATAIFGNVILAPRTVTLDSSRTVGVLRFDNSNAYDIAGPNTSTLTFDQSTGDAELSVLQGNHVISTKVALTDSVSLAFANPTQSVDLTGEVSGAGGITKSGGGSLTLSGQNTFLGDVSFAGGSLSFGNDGLGGGNLTLDGTSLVWLSGNTEDISDRTVTFGANPIVLNPGTNDVTLANAIGGASATPVSKLGSGKLTLEADQGFTGAVTISEGILQLGNAGTTGFVTGNITNNGGLVVSRSNNVTLSQIISGSGTLAHAGASVLTLGVANTFNGQTTISDPSGVLRLGNSLALQSSTLIYPLAGGSLNFGTLTAATLGGLSGDKDLALTNTALTPAAVALTIGGNGETTAYSGDLSGMGSLVKTGAGDLNLTGQHSYSGTTTVNGGILRLGPAGVISTPATTVNVALLNIDGGSFTSAGIAQINSGGTNGFLLSSGSATVATIQTSTGDGNLIAVAGGTFTASSVILQRTASAGAGDDPTNSATSSSGFVVTDGVVSVTNALNIGTSNSSASALFDGGSSVISGLLSVGNNTATGRWNILEVRSGVFESTEAAGVLLSPFATFANKSQFLMTGGVATVPQVSFGGASPASGAIGRLTLSGGELYVGAGGLVRSSPSFTSQIQLWGGLLAASAPWTTSLPMDLLGLSTIKAANEAGLPRNITLTGALAGSGGLVKQGAGILTLSGGHAYTGATVVSAGTLRVTTRTFSDEAVIVVNNVGTGSALELSYSGGDRVASFQIEDVEQSAGVYGRVGSGAQFETAAITGNGLLYVNTEVPSATGFSLWISGTFANGTIPGDKQGPNDDPDNDGIDNLTEYAIASLDPTVSNGSVGTFTGLTLSFAKRQPLASDITYSIVQSTDLGILDAWTGVTGAPPVYVNDDETISYTLPGGPAKDFVRLKVAQN